jgi:sugar lactone lactonase YvrE
MLLQCTPSIKTIWTGQADLGEGPMWHPEEKQLYWIDIAKSQINRLNIDSRENQTWQFSSFIGAVIPRAKGGVVATVGNEVIALNTDNGQIEKISNILPKASANLRGNDGKCDKKGRLWFGMVDVNLKQSLGGLFRMDSEGNVDQMEENIIISNGMGWNPDSTIFYYIDSAQRCVFQYDFDMALGAISNRKVLIKLEDSEAVPDGMTVDQKGYLWIAIWNAWKLIRYSPNGSISKVINFPVQRPTSCIFGGEDYKTLFVTSCSLDVGEKNRLPKPAGSLFSFQVETPGSAENSFMG